VCIVSARQLIAEHHCYKRRLRQIFYAWKKWLETEVSGRHRDAIIDANKEQFHKIMEETDQAIEEIVNIEKKRNEHLRKQEEEVNLRIVINILEVIALNLNYQDVQISKRKKVKRSFREGEGSRNIY
jgi:vacuolar-type H+-ATPase subunit E/Vma4